MHERVHMPGARHAARGPAPAADLPCGTKRKEAPAETAEGPEAEVSPGPDAEWAELLFAASLCLRTGPIQAQAWPKGSSSPCRRPQPAATPARRAPWTWSCATMP
mmetsp:Transcript_23576/g.79221  ORF Transcript_23576/g.79221 Transcript_23576/m.79221 type:complete len:105 (+) Transcript_23576:672-986(+)